MRKLFKDVKIGDMFSYLDMPFAKIRPVLIVGDPDQKPFNVVCLSSGNLVRYFKPYFHVSNVIEGRFREQNELSKEQ